MLTGLRAGDAPLLQRLCGGDTRIFLRLGALLQERLAITEPALEALLADPQGKILLSNRSLAQTNPSSFPALTLHHHANVPGLVMIDEQGGAETGWRVIALDDELNNPLLANSAPTGQSPVVEAMEIMGTLTPAMRVPVEGFLAARADDQRAAALEQLRYAMPPLTIVGELMPLLLADSAELVRERAISLLMSAGAHVVVVDLIRALHANNETALIRLGEAIANLPNDQQDLAVAALIASCARGVMSPAIIALCCRLAEHLATHRNLPRLIELLISSRLSILDLVRALQHYDSDRVDSILRRQFGQGAESDTTLIILLARPGIPADQSLLERGVDLLLASTSAPVERMALASAIRRLDGNGTLADMLANRSARIPESWDTSVHWLIAELCRDGSIAPAADRLAIALRHWLREASGPHLVAILEQQLPALIPAAAPLRSALVEPLVEVITRFKDERTSDLIDNCLRGIGEAAIVPLWLLVEEHPQLPVRLMAIHLVPRLVERTKVNVDSGAQRLLAGLHRAEQAEERSALIAAAASLTALDECSPAVAIAVDAATSGLGSWAIEALGYIAAGPHCEATRRSAIIHQLLERLCENVQDTDAEPVRDPATDDITFILDEQLTSHTADVPRLLSALGRIGASPHISGAQLATLIARLCDQWRQVATWQTIWGPANIQELGALLGHLASQRNFPGPLRIRIAESLLPLIQQLAIARSLARLLTVADGPYLSRLAGRAVARFIQHVSDEVYAEDEMPDVVEVLVHLLAIPQLGDDGDTMRRKLVALIGSLRASCTSRARAKIRGIMPDLSTDLQARLDWA